MIGHGSGHKRPNVAPATLFLTLLAVTACATPPPQKTAAEHQQSLGSTQERKVTLGTVQSSITEGMAQADVATALGSPNIVTTDADGAETWIYDKIATETSRSESTSGQAASSSGGVLAGGFMNTLGAIVGIGGIGGSTASSSSDRTGASAQTQRTLTVVIKFDRGRKVKSVTSQASSF
ncbi:MAG: hypothetical protein KDE35_11640 [Geminicoccaceae bacterium]|nr:hypothetical protein [Geminicoccaceae bacterium]